MCQEKLSCIEIASIGVATLSFIAAIASLRAARRTTILSILTERAKETNELYNENPKNYIAPIITAQQQLNLTTNFIDIILCLRQQYFIDMFYLTLHTSIRIDLWLETTPESKEPTIVKQFKSAKKFLEISHKEWDKNIKL